MSARRPLRSAVALAAALAVGFIFSAGAQAAPGDLDVTFSGDGKQRTNFDLGRSTAEATVRQPDGKVVVVGQANFDFGIARYNPDGSLDPSFSGNGRQTTHFGNEFSNNEATAVALQADGKIVAVGATGSSDFAIARYNPNGSLDTSFSGDGKQITDFGLGSEDRANGVAVQGDGKIVVVGGDNNDFLLARYNTNGSLDPAFSGDGKQTTHFADGCCTEGASDVAIQANGKIVAVGVQPGNAQGAGDFALARYNLNGSLDTTFSVDGKQTTDFGGNEGAGDVAIQSDGKIIAVGRGVNGGVDIGDFMLARYNPNGTLDSMFSGDGKQTTDFGAADGANAVAVQADGKVVAAGDTAGDFALARYNPNGSPDTTFSGDGKETTDFGATDGANAAVLQGDGKIVAVGTSRTSTLVADFALARYNTDGSLDPSFSVDGKQTTDFASNEGVSAAAVQSDGKIVAVGGAGGDFVLARYNPNGSPDLSFSGDGTQTTDLGGGIDGASDVAIQPDGKILAVGTGGSSRDFALARYNPNGSLDPSFSGDGLQKTSFTPVDGATAVALQGNGKIVAVGFAGGGGTPHFNFALARYNPNGSPDATFSGDGKETTDIGGGYDQANGVVLQGAKIVAVGATSHDGFALARYNANGSLDPTFSGDGKQTTNIGVSAGANGAVLQADGRIVAAGDAAIGSQGRTFALARYNPNGTLDTSFSGDGKQTTDFGGEFDRGNGVALQGSKIVEVGTADRGPGVDDFALARYNPNGSLDLSFSGDGRQTTDFGGNDGASDVAIQPAGRIVAVGSGLGTDGTSDFALARFLGG